MIGHHDTGAVFKRLQATFVWSVERSVNLLLAESRSERIRVRVDEAHQLRFILWGLAADHELHDLTWLYTVVICIAGEGMVGNLRQRGGGQERYLEKGQKAGRRAESHGRHPMRWGARYHAEQTRYGKK